MDKAKLKNLPDSPGVYLMKDKSDKILYIGKASSLKKRVSSYFHAKDVSYRQRIWVPKVEKIDFIPTHSEAEALIYEASFIRSMRPKYNVDLKDDKSYPYLKLTNEEYPKLIITRRRLSDGARYFGPFTNVKLLKKAILYMRKIFPLRTCNRLPKKVCILYHINECIGPCSSKVSKGEYGRIVKELVLFLEGRRKELLKKLTGRMKLAAHKMHFEEALSIRDKISALSIATEGGVKISAFDEVEDLRHLLRLRRRLHRIEAFDISNISGKEAVGSMVVFINGKPAKSEYRKYRIKTVDQIDDYAMMKEVIMRRYKRVLKERLRLPDLIIIDGGKGHLSAACAALSVVGAYCNTPLQHGRSPLPPIPIIGIAKEFERIWLPGEDIPLSLHKNSPILHLLQRIRDEAHRFAHAYFRVLRRKKIVGF